jgi:tRNA(adenine34) deaminase
VSSSDESFMKEALIEAKKAFDQNEIPVGAVLVLEGKIIARAHNLVEKMQDASAHAEMLVIKEASNKIENWRLKGAELYCTLEPCPMCAGVMILSRIDTLIWGAPDLRHGAHGSWTNLLDASHPIHNLKVRKGVLQEEAAFLMKEFFQRRRLLC